MREQINNVICKCGCICLLFAMLGLSKMMMRCTAFYKRDKFIYVVDDVTVSAGCYNESKQRANTRDFFSTFVLYSREKSACGLFNFVAVSTYVCMLYMSKKLRE